MLLTYYLGTGHFQRLLIEGTLLVILYVYDINRLSSPSEICACHTQVVYRVPPSTIPDTVQESLQRMGD